MRNALLQLTFAALIVASAPEKPPNVLIVGGSSGMGKAAALATIENGGRTMLISRSRDKLATAKEYLMSKVPDAEIETAVLDATNEKEVEQFSAGLQEGFWDGLVVSCAGKAPHGKVTELPVSDTRSMVETKFWSAYNCAKHISKKLQSGGCVVFVAGILNRRPGINCAPLAIANGSLEALTRTCALEWGPELRCNCLSPGFCNTERFDHLTSERKQKMFDNTAASLPLQRIGEPEDMGHAIYYLLTAKFCTGVILDVDGGHGIRQYASAMRDPMRSKK